MFHAPWGILPFPVENIVRFGVKCSSIVLVAQSKGALFWVKAKRLATQRFISVKTMDALRSAMAEVDAYYKARGIF
jgi:hypothetical protein